MRLARAILSLSALVITLAGVSAFSANPPATSSAEPALPVAAPTNGDHCLDVNDGPEGDTAMGPETALQAETVSAALDDPCDAAGSDSPAESVTQVACDQPAYGGPFPSPEPKKLWCADLWDGDCFAGCCGPRGRIRQWAQCCQAAGGPCSAGCAECTQRYRCS